MNKSVFAFNSDQVLVSAQGSCQLLLLIEKADFNELLECAAPKPWLKYTTPSSSLHMGQHSKNWIVKFEKQNLNGKLGCYEKSFLGTFLGWVYLSFS